MADRSQAEELAAQAADAVRNVVAAAEARASEIIREAEAEAAGIRERAEADAREARDKAEADARAQIDAARKALDELGGSLAAAVSSAPPGGQAPAESEPQPELEPERQTETPGAPVTPVSPPIQEAEQPAAEEGGPAPGDGDEAAERLVAMKLAVEGKDPAAIEAELVERFGPGDRADLLHEVLSRISR